MPEIRDTVDRILTDSGYRVTSYWLANGSSRSHLLRNARADVAGRMKAEGFTHAEIGQAIGLRDDEAIARYIRRGS